MIAGIYAGTGNIRGRKRAFVNLNDGKLGEFSLGEFRRIFGRSALKLLVGDRVFEDAPVSAPFVDKFDHTAVWPAGVPFPVELANGESRLMIETSGPFGCISKIRGLAVEKHEDGVMVYGIRTLQKQRESGYQREGYVNIPDGKRSSFTASQLFLVEGKLVDVGILYMRTPKEKTT